MTNYNSHLNSLQSLQLRNGTIRYIDKGHGEIIILVHGVPTSSWLYRNVIDYLVNKGYRVIAPDLLGFGDSEKREGYEIYSEENQGKALIALLDHLEINDWTHVCHDAGGLWTWAMIENGKIPSRLILLNTVIYESGFHPPLRFEKNWIGKIYSKMYSGFFSGALMKATLGKGTFQKLDWSKEIRKGYISPMKSGGDKTLFYFFSQTCNKLPDVESTLQSLDIPVGVFWGMKDTILRWKPMAERVVKDLGINEDDIFLSEKCSHFVQEDNPTELSNFIIKFIERHNKLNN